MKINYESLSQKWKKGALLSLALALGTGAGVTAFSPQPVEAASVSAQSSVAVYNQFEKYVKSPASLGQARKYLINHIDEVNLWQATIMTLHLENAQMAHLDTFSKKLYPEKIQKAIDSALRAKDYQRSELTYTYLLSVIKDSSIRAVLIESRDKGYKIETSEGMYYPVMHYEGFKVFKPYITKDIAAYIDIMARESNKPTIFDAAIVISWNELISRTLEKEAFVKKFPNSNRTLRIKNNLSQSLGLVFYGSSNTPAYGYEKPMKLDPELREAYDKAVGTGSPSSGVIKKIKGLLELLDKSGNELTPAIESYIENLLKS
jgi:hypothetical protein